jgi:hypothetical protein
MVRLWCCWLPNGARVSPGSPAEVDGDPPRGLLRRAVDLPERHVPAHPPIRQDFRDGGGQRGLPVVDVPIVPMLRCGLSRMYACLVMTDLLLIPPAALADPARAHRGARCATLPRQVNQANGEGSTSRAAASQQTGRRQQCEAAVIAERASARATKTANRNTPASVRHQPPRPQRVFAAAAASSTGKPFAAVPHSDAHRLTRNAAKMILVTCNIDVHAWLGAVVFRLSGNER